MKGEISLPKLDVIVTPLALRKRPERAQEEKGIERACVGREADQNLFFQRRRGTVGEVGVGGERETMGKEGWHEQVFRGLGSGFLPNVAAVIPGGEFSPKRKFWGRGERK